MKFLCSHCKAKYQIADEKVAGRTLRMTCRSCQQEIMIRGDLPVPPTPAPIAVPVQAPRAAYAAAVNMPARRQASGPLAPSPSPLGAEFQRQVGASAIAPPQLGPIDEWHVGINDVPVGPMRREEIARKLAAGSIHPDSLAWREGLDDWLPLRNIPELAVLCAPGMSVAPPPLHSPAQRTELGPIGGRAGASPAYAVEDWAQVAPMTEPNPSQVSINPTLSVPSGERRTGMPSISVIFALAAGFALLTAVVAIFGARWLQGGQQAPVAVADKPAAAPAPVVAAPAAAPAQPATDQGTAEVGEMVIGLDDTLQGDSRGGTRPRAGTGAAASGGKQPPKKELTAEQKAMLARMGGGDSPSNLNLGSQNAQGAATQRAGTGTLSQADVSKVVLRGRVNLQRCYETALRGSGSTDTVRMDVELTVSPSGNATNVKTSGQGLPGMAQCIERTVKMWRFPSSGEESPIKFPVVFQPGS